MKNVTLSINTEDLHRARKIVDIGGVTAEIMVSPFSSPKELMVRHEPASHRIVLEFRYIDSEPPAPLPFVHEGIQITQGKYSRKILKIIAPVERESDAEEFKKLGQRITDALKSRRRIFQPQSIAGAADDVERRGCGRDPRRQGKP